MHSKVLKSQLRQPLIRWKQKRNKVKPLLTVSNAACTLYINCGLPCCLRSLSTHVWVGYKTKINSFVTFSVFTWPSDYDDSLYIIFDRKELWWLIIKQQRTYCVTQSQVPHGTGDMGLHILPFTGMTIDIRKDSLCTRSLSEIHCLSNSVTTEKCWYYGIKVSMLASILSDTRHESCSDNSNRI